MPAYRIRGRQAVSLPLPACPGRQDASGLSPAFPTPPTGEVARLGALGQRGRAALAAGGGCCWSPAEPGSSGPIWSPALTRTGGPTSLLTKLSATQAKGPH